MYIYHIYRICMTLTKTTTENVYSTSYTLYNILYYSHILHCTQISDRSSFFQNVYATAGSFGTICTGLWCNNPSLTDKCSLILPAERTSCGNQKVRREHNITILLFGY